jgi:hypothetical protein
MSSGSITAGLLRQRKTREDPVRTLGCIQPQTIDSQGDEIVRVLGKPPADEVCLRCQAGAQRQISMVTRGVPRTSDALCKSTELARPHLDFVVPIYDVVVGLEVAMVEILVLVDTGIVVVGEVWRSQFRALRRAIIARQGGRRTASRHTFPRILRSHVVPNSV